MNDEKMLSMISKNAEMGVVGIDAVKDYASSEKFKKELMNQRSEYSKIYKSAYSMLKESGCDVSHVNPMAKMSTEMMSRMKTMADPTDLFSRSFPCRGCLYSWCNRRRDPKPFTYNFSKT